MIYNLATIYKFTSTYNTLMSKQHNTNTNTVVGSASSSLRDLRTAQDIPLGPGRAQKSSEELRRAQKGSGELRRAQKSSEELRRAHESSEGLGRAQKAQRMTAERMFG